jgi:RNA polymerase I-specific transcription initiation factor RRN3
MNTGVDQSASHELEQQVKDEVLQSMKGSEHHLGRLKARIAQSRQPWSSKCICEIMSEHVQIIANSAGIFLKLFPALEQVEWFDDASSEDLGNAFGQLLVDLVCANGCFLSPSIKVLVRNFLHVPLYKSLTGRDASELTVVGERLHRTLKSLLKMVPLGVQALLPALVDRFPHKAVPLSKQEYFLCHALYVCDYVPVVFSRILTLVVERMILLDVEIKLADAFSDEEVSDTDEPVNDDDDEGMFSMDEESPQKLSRRHHGTIASQPAHQGKERKRKALMVDETAEKLDVVMNILLNFLETHFNEKHFEVLQRVFDDSIIRTHRSKYVQFLVFWACNKDPVFMAGFLQRLVTMLMADNAPMHLRRTCCSYLASFVSRAEYLDVTIVYKSLFYLLSIAQSHIQSHSYGISRRQEAGLLKQHELFYSICQSAFYIVAFRGADALHNSEALKNLKSLPWQAVLTCGLDPLKYCLDSVCREFICVAKNLGLVSAAWLNHTEKRLQMNQLMCETEDVADGVVKGRQGCVTPMRKNRKRQRLESQTEEEPASIQSSNIECSMCGKWRACTPDTAAAYEDGKWSCALNTLNPRLANCDAPEETVDDHLDPQSGDEDTSALGLVENPLDSFFPFDPCLLRRTQKHLDGLYRHWSDSSGAQKAQQRDADQAGKVLQSGVSIPGIRDRAKSFDPFSWEEDSSPPWHDDEPDKNFHDMVYKGQSMSPDSESMRVARIGNTAFRPNAHGGLMPPRKRALSQTSSPGSW